MEFLISRLLSPYEDDGMFVSVKTLDLVVTSRITASLKAFIQPLYIIIPLTVHTVYRLYRPQVGASGE